NGRAFGPIGRVRSAIWKAFGSYAGGTKSSACGQLAARHRESGGAGQDSAEARKAFGGRDADHAGASNRGRRNLRAAEIIPAFAAIDSPSSREIGWERLSGRVGGRLDSDGGADFANGGYL